jgi:hypothetical protein
MAHGKSQGPAFTLSPLARPGKAVALEARIELWSASDHSVAFQFPKTILRCDETAQLSTSPVTDFVSTETGLAAMRRYRYPGRAVGGQVSLLTSPFIERLRRANEQAGRAARTSAPGLSEAIPGGNFPETVNHEIFGVNRGLRTFRRAVRIYQSANCRKFIGPE